MKIKQHFAASASGVAMLILFCCTSCKKENISGTPVSSSDSSDVRLKNINTKVLFGSPVNNNFTDTAYTNITLREFSAGQSLWYARYGGWLSQFTYDFTNFNAVVNWLLQNGKAAQMHMLIGPNQYMPEWLVTGTWTNAQLDTLLLRMIYAIMDANDNKNNVDVWNVVNEAFNYDNGFYQTDVIWNQLGWEADQSGLTGADKINTKHPVYIRKAFQYCREKTNNKLELRDYNIENNNPVYGWDDKHKGFYQLVKHMQNSGIPINAAGIQGHQETNNTGWLIQNNDLQTVVQKFKALGLDVYITEMDMACYNGWNSTVAQQQRSDYYNYTLQAIKGGATRIYTWGIKDGDPYWLTYNHPLLWDETYRRKQAYFGVAQALNDTK
ncbi:MAG TPA: endo-1,4-beta-xylanase [Chitinophagaceae bacterium]|nr:endo-1,4-beta-xylanase [Chitinophagaceae bacterium]